MLDWKNRLTLWKAVIILSAFVDINELIVSGRGTGPVKPRQPAGARSFGVRCQIQLGAGASGKDEKSDADFPHLFSPDGKGFFVAPMENVE
jgi:hypothetical protein